MTIYPSEFHVLLHLVTGVFQIPHTNHSIISRVLLRWDLGYTYVCLCVPCINVLGKVDLIRKLYGRNAILNKWCNLSALILVCQAGMWKVHIRLITWTMTTRGQPETVNWHISMFIVVFHLVYHIMHYASFRFVCVILPIIKPQVGIEPNKQLGIDTSS